MILLLLLAIQPAADIQQTGVAPPAYDQLLREGEPQSELRQPDRQTQDATKGSSDDGDHASPSKKKLKATERTVERVGELYERLGHCTGSMTAEEVQEALSIARQQGPAADYLTARFAKGFRSPKGDEWCRKEVASATRTIERQ